jgi:hypothetical protein
LYAQKQINNCKKISEFYERVIGANQIEQPNGMGNMTILMDDHETSAAVIKRTTSIPMDLQARNFNGKLDNSRQTIAPGLINNLSHSGIRRSRSAEKYKEMF